MLSGEHQGEVGGRLIVLIRYRFGLRHNQGRAWELIVQTLLTADLIVSD